MYRVSVKRHFDAAHGLRGYHGKCENMHGHRWEIVISISGRELDKDGMACDFNLLKRALDGVLERYDHHNLNEVPPYDALNPSSENIARIVYKEMCIALPDYHFEQVEAWESPDAWVTFIPDTR